MIANVPQSPRTSALPLVTIGLPVRNGMPLLRTAVETLLKQTYGNVEIIISDNASVDRTSEYGQALAEVYPQVRYSRTAENIGPAENFRRVLSQARGEFFMWASDDDKWGESFVAALAESLSANPHAVLATPAVIHIRPDGTLCSEPPDRPAPGLSPIANLKQLYNDHAATWIYGLWRTDWLRQHIDEYATFPYWGADILWLADICLRCPVVGNQEAVIYKRFRRSRYAPRTTRAAVAFWIYMFWHLSRMCLRRMQGFGPRAQTLALSWRYVYQLCIRRPYLLRTTWRVVRMLSIASITCIPVAAVYTWRALSRKVLATRAN